MPRVAVAGCLAAFALIGALASVYGPLIPFLQARYGVPRSTAGSVLSAHFSGSLAGVVWTAWAARRLRGRAFLVPALASIAVGGVLLAAAPRWWVVLAGAAAAGFGSGILDFGLNRLFAQNFGARKGAMLNVLNALYGVGAVAGPLIVAATAARHARWIFVGTALLAACVAPSMALVRVGGAAPDRPVPDRPGRARLPPGLGLFIAAYLLYMGVEAGIGGWEPTHLKAVGFSAASAASATSVFWLCLTAGRFGVAAVALRVSARRIVLVSAVASVVALGVALRAPLAPYGYAAAGLTLAPIFPTGLAWLAQTRPDSDDAVAYLLAAVMLGGAVFPLGTGWIIQRAGAAATPAVLGALALGCAAAFTMIPAGAGSARAGRS